MACYTMRTYEENFNPRPPRGGRRSNAAIDYTALVISIHAPREGGDRPGPWDS